MEGAPLRPVPSRPAGSVDPGAARSHVATALPGLGELEAAALALAALVGRPRPELAAELGASPAEVADVLTRARKALRRSMVALPGSGWCERAERLISDRLDGALEPPGPARLDVHLRNCARCVEHERRLVQATDGLAASFAHAGAPAEEPPEEEEPGQEPDPEGPGDLPVLTLIRPEEVPPALPPLGRTSPVAPITRAVEEPRVEEPPVVQEMPGQEAPRAEEPRVEEPPEADSLDEEPPEAEVPAEREPTVAEPQVAESQVAEPPVEEPQVAEPPVEEPPAEQPQVVAATAPPDERPAPPAPGRSASEWAASAVWHGLFVLAVLLALVTAVLGVAGVLGASP